MKGFLLFLGIWFSMMLSWYGFVHVPRLQLGGETPEVDRMTGRTYPLGRSGEARRGLDVYRRQGCHACHTQEVRQRGFDFSVVVEDWGTNTMAVLERLGGPDALPRAPHTLDAGLDLPGARALVREWQALGTTVQWINHPRGADIERWGPRRTVGRDFLHDAVVMPGTLRIGPDLANVGNRIPDENRLFLHLYQPRLLDENSSMPSYPFLFEVGEGVGRPGGLRHPDLPGSVHPTRAARDLVAYLGSLRVDEPVFEAPGLAVAASPAEEE